jgi:hypothetical protein
MILHAFLRIVYSRLVWLRDICTKVTQLIKAKIMNTRITNYIRKGSQIEWQPLLEEGVDTKGISIKALRYDQLHTRPLTFLLKFELGARYPYHNHPAGEEIFVVEGSCQIEGETLSSGDYLYTPPASRHAVKSETDCVLFLMVPQEVQIIGQK